MDYPKVITSNLKFAYKMFYCVTYIRNFVRPQPLDKRLLRYKLPPSTRSRHCCISSHNCCRNLRRRFRKSRQSRTALRRTPNLNSNNVNFASISEN